MIIKKKKTTVSDEKFSSKINLLILKIVFDLEHTNLKFLKSWIEIKLEINIMLMF